MLKHLCQRLCTQNHGTKGTIQVYCVRNITSYRVRQTPSELQTEEQWLEKLLPKWRSKQELCDLLLNNVLYEDDHVIAFNKPSNLSMFSPRFDSGTTVGSSSHYNLYFESIKKDIKQSRNVKLLKETYILNRLYSGVIAFAKTQRAVDVLTKYFIHTTTNRIKYQKYRALTVGIPDPQNCTEKMLLNRILTDDSKVCVKSVKTSLPRRKPGQTRDIISSEIELKTLKTSCISRSCSVALVELLPTRCKWDLLQVFMLHKLAPVLGDHQYSGRLRFILGKPIILDYRDHDHYSSVQILPPEIQKRLELNSIKNATSVLPLHIHCQEVSLPKIHPMKGHLKSEKITIKAPLPPYFQHIQSVLGLS